ncbi:MAG: hypothetical protein HYX28_02730 [Candidatus Koribacter versatilis]|uniref:Uncharacterized protein n=1 Tax=Candidatus Korobacter versatilis TaxID=658062 RepID=A0A932A6N1_9BACT|nr:hypothetical protein [Candidatus Koribacter versatilis]
MSFARVANTTALALLLALLLAASLARGQSSGSAGLAIRVHITQTLSSSIRSAGACLPLGGAYLTLDEAALPADCNANTTGAEPPVLLVRATLPVALPVATNAQAPASAAEAGASAGTPCQVTTSEPSAWKGELPENAKLCTATVIPD